MSQTPVRDNGSYFDSRNQPYSPVSPEYEAKVYDLVTMKEGNTTVYGTPSLYNSMSPTFGGRGGLQPLTTNLDHAGKQDEVLKLKAALNEKEMELIELREQHMQLVARSQEARANWEAALDSKDRAIGQLEEALAARQRVVEQLEAGQAMAERAAREAQMQHAKEVQEQASALAEANAKITQLQNSTAERGAQLQAAQKQIDVLSSIRPADEQLEARLKQSMGELQNAHARALQLEREGLSAAQENAQLRSLLYEKDGDLKVLVQKHHALREELLRLRDELKTRPAQHAQHGRQTASPRDDLSDAIGANADPRSSRKSWSRLEGSRELTALLSARVEELQQQLAEAGRKLDDKDASARKYKDAVRALKVKLGEKDAALAERQARLNEMHAELTQVQQLLKQGPPHPSPSRRSSPAKSRSAAVNGVDTAAMLSAELERLKIELHGQHMEMTTMRMELMDKDKLLQKALTDLESAEVAKRDAASRASDAARRLYDTERKLREAEDGGLRLAQQHKDGQERVAELEAKLKAAQEELNGHSRSTVELESRAREAELRVKELSRQVKVAAAQVEEVERRAEDAARRGAASERKVLELESRLEAAAGEVEKLSAAGSRADRTVRELEAQLADADRRLKQADGKGTSAEWRAREAEGKLSEHDRRCRDADARAADAESRAKEADMRTKAAESRAADAERHAAELDARLSATERKLRELDGQLMDYQQRWRDAERLRQEAESSARGAEAAAKQARVERDADVAELHAAGERRRQQELADAQELRVALHKAKAAKAQVDKRAAELESALAQVEALNSALRGQVAAEAEAAQKVAALQARVASLEEMVKLREKTVQQLREGLAKSESEHLRALQALRAELQDKDGQLTAAEARFEELEELMQRIAIRASNAGGGDSYPQVAML